MPRTRDEARAAEVRALASEGKNSREISAETGVPLRTVQRWLAGRPKGAPRLPEGEGSRTTRWRQRQRAGAEVARQPDAGTGAETGRA